jgi:glutaredoxin 2
MIGKNLVVVMGQNDSVRMADALHIVAMEDLPLKSALAKSDRRQSWWKRRQK